MLGKVKMYTRTEMLDVVIVDGQAKGIVTRNLDNRQNRNAYGPCRIVMYRRLRQRVLSVDQCDGFKCYSGLEGT